MTDTTTHTNAGSRAAAGSAVCEWTQNGTADWFQSDCGYSFDFLDDGPLEAGFKFCPFCGLPIRSNESRKPLPPNATGSATEGRP